MIDVGVIILFKSLVVSHGFSRHLYFIIITLVISFIVIKINLKLVSKAGLKISYLGC